jgi:hypothetical protein
MLRMEMFIVGDGTIRVEHVGVASRLMSWKLYVEKGWVLDNMDNMEFVVIFYGTRKSFF